MANYIGEYNKLIPLLNKLSKDNFDIWEYHSNQQGYGFKVIFEKSWVDITINLDFTSEKVEYWCDQYKRRGNCFSILDEGLQSKTVSTIEEIENFIRQVAKSEKEE